jgi:hypothetical protein
VVGTGVIAFATALVAMTTATEVFRVAVYRYAATGEAGGGFTESDLQSAFRRRRRRLFG